MFKKNRSVSFCEKQLYCYLLRWWLLYIIQIERYNKCIIKNIPKTFKLTDGEGFKCYIGMNARKDTNGTITMIQPAIIDKILNSLRICDKSKMHDTPKKFILTRDKYGNGRKQEWHYRSVIGQMNYLYGTTRPDIIFSVHQCAK